MSLLEGVTRKNVTEDNIPCGHEAIKPSLGPGGKSLFRTSQKPFNYSSICEDVAKCPPKLATLQCAMVDFFYTLFLKIHCLKENRENKKIGQPQIA